MSTGHKKLETNISLMAIFIVIAVSLGGLVEIVPLFALTETTEPVEGVEKYSALRLEGRDIYVREGCYNCHSQMIRTLKPDVMRYGDYSRLGESIYDHPFQWGSKRTGPDLARVGGKYSNDWHVQHLVAPRSVVPDSIMPNYPWLTENALDYSDIAGKMRALRMVGVPYSESDVEYEQNVEKFGKEMADMFNIHRAQENLLAQAQQGNFDGNQARLTEMDALVAYLQMLGTLVDFSKYDEGYFAEFR